MSEWWMYEKPAARRPASGIKARSRSGDIGRSWWSGRFLAALKEVADTGRLGRGRSYARSGQVLDLNVSAGAVTARVQGSRRSPYQVRIALAPFTEAEWARAEAALAEQALFLASLLSGEMPPDVEDAFAAVGLSLFPSRKGELTTDCSCPDWGNPCKHAAAAYYILAEAFDDDPFLVLAWRGRARDPLLARLRELRSAATPSHEAPAAPAPETQPEPRTGAFWRAGPELAGLRFDPRAAEVPDAVIRQLGPLPEIAGGQRCTNLLAAAYRTFTAQAARRAFGGEASAGPRDVLPPVDDIAPRIDSERSPPTAAPGSAGAEPPPAAAASPEEAVLRHVDRHGRITRGEAADLCGILPVDASRLLKRLVSEGALVLHGERRAAHYRGPRRTRSRTPVDAGAPRPDSNPPQSTAAPESPGAGAPSAAAASPEEAVLRHVDRHGRITRGEAADLCGIAPGDASRLLKRLVSEGALVLHGERRTACYRRPAAARGRAHAKPRPR